MSAYVGSSKNLKDLKDPPHLWQTARPLFSRDNCLCCTPVLKLVKVLKVLTALCRKGAGQLGGAGGLYSCVATCEGHSITPCS